MSNELHNTFRGFPHWFAGGGWIVLVVILAVIIGCLLWASRGRRY
jgi:hypothetical protein